MQSLNKSDVIEQKDFDQLKIRYLELMSLFEINKILNSTLDLRSILDNVLLTPMGRLMISKGMVFLHKSPNRLQVENLKGMSLKFLGLNFTIETLPNSPVLLSTIDAPHERLFAFLQENGIEVLIPLIANDRYLGILAFGKKFSGTGLSEDEIEFLVSLSHLAAIAVDKSLMFEELRQANKRLDKKIQELNTLFEISRELNATLDIEKLTNILTFAIMGEMLVNKCVILLVDDGNLQAAVGKGVKIQPFQRRLILTKSDLTGLFPSSLSSLLVEELPNSSRFGRLKRQFEEWGIDYLIPMRAQDEIKGIIGIGKKIAGAPVSDSELEFLSTIGNDAVIAIENARLVKEMLEKQRLEEELKIACQIQQRLLPEKCPQFDNFSIAGTNLPSYQVGGDYYDCIALGNDRVGLAIADVSGKGTPAALLMANLQASLRALALDKEQVNQIVARINNLIHRNTAEDKFITFFYGVVDTKEKTLVYVNAGHNPPILFHHDGSFQQLEKGGLLLGMLPNVPYEQEEVKLQAGDVLILYTDGVTEALNEQDEEYGVTRLIEEVGRNLSLSSEQLVSKIVESVKTFAQSPLQSDDITILVGKMS